MPNVPTDHKMVLVRYTPPHLPYIGKGRWSWPLGLLHDQRLLGDIFEQGRALQTALADPTIPAQSPQLLWSNFKVSIANLAQQAEKSHIPKITNRLRTLQRDADSISTAGESDLTEDARRNITLIESEIRYLTANKNRNGLACSQAQ